MASSIPAALEIAAAAVKQFEGWSATPYQDSKGVWTIGYGTTRIDNEPVGSKTPPITVDQGVDYLEADLQTAYTAVVEGVKVAATDNQTAAFTSFAYNEGVSAFLGSTLLKLFNDRDIAGCEAQFSQWVYCSIGGQLVRIAGLVNRRNAELALFKTPDAAPATAPVPPSPGADAPSVPAAPGSSVAPGPVAAAPDAPPTLLLPGMQGGMVSRMQTLLRDLGFYAGAIDGDYGPVTKEAVAKFQQGHGLYIDGICGAQTWAALLAGGVT
jgi:lysozyme